MSLLHDKVYGHAAKLPVNGNASIARVAWRAAKRDVPSIIVIDVEGAELNVLQGAAKLLRDCRPQLIIEDHGYGRRAQIADTLVTHGYEVHLLGPRHVHAIARRSVEERLS